MYNSFFTEHQLLAWLITKYLSKYKLFNGEINILGVFGLDIGSELRPMVLRLVTVVHEGIRIEKVCQVFVTYK